VLFRSIKTRLGYHIVKVEDKLPDRIHVRHILIKTQASSEDQKQIFAKADSLRQLILDGEAEFSEMVKQYSIDDESKRLGGELGWFPLERVTPEFGVAIEDLEIGDLSKPTKSDFGIHIIKLLDRKQSREMTLRDDWDRIKDFARREKSDRVLQDWLGEVRHETYVDIRI
jgi:peptidyl-prolyl cis-trans isomerase SurA